MSGIPTMFKSRRLRRVLFGGLVGVTAVTGIALMFDIMRNNGITGLEIAILSLFALTFTWIAIPFWNAVIGFVLSVLRRDPLSLGASVTPGNCHSPLASRTALVMPVHNEDPSRVTAGLAAMLRSLERTGQATHFDLFLLSDTTVPAIAAAEEAAWASLDSQMGHFTGLHYRRRAANVGRKAGNISDFCERWGTDYDFMVVVDADSIMTGTSLVELVRLMEANPNAGLVQTVPIPARRSTLFGRLVQFAGCLYGPVLAIGQSFWQTDTANYWGHNAIVRVKPFTDHCRLPVLSGRPPLGGAILSHDFVEAALMRRAGWEVYLQPLIEGSYEEAPETVVDYAKRDRRWIQGSLQHLRLLGTPGLHFLNRLYFLFGAAGYLSSAIWLLLLLAGSVYVLVPSLSDHVLISIAAGDRRAPVSLLLVTGVLLFVPKLLALVLALTGPRHLFAGTRRLLTSVVLETLFAVVVAPVMMLYHTRSVVSVLIGHDITWSAQAREGRELEWRETGRSVGWMTAVGVVWGAVTLYYSPVFFLWLTPIFTGLLFAAPLLRWTSSPVLGDWVKRRGLLLVPSETVPPAELHVSPWSADAPRRESGLPVVPPPEAEANLAG